jgi:site-specific recombinase XerD
MAKELQTWRDGFASYARQHGELATSTVAVYSRCLDIFMHFLSRRQVKTIERLQLADLDAFMAQQGERMKPKSLYTVRAALRYFLKWLYVEGTLATDFSCRLLRPSRFSADQRPKYLPWAKVEKLLDGMEKNTLAGKRDYAILTMLALHGLRAGEVAKLRIEDIDLKEGSFLLRCRKDGRCARLPLAPRAKEALEDYLRLRGDIACAEVFLNAPPPPQPLATATIGHIAHDHLRQRFPRGLPSYGSHVFRHSFAKCLLDRGARLADIGLILGHRNMRSTMMYARIATKELGEVADNYARLL